MSYSTAQRGSKVVTDGLILYLDAANPRSYPGSGDTWYDLTKYNNNGILTNGPTFDSANGGSFVFDGVDDYLENTCLIEAATSNNLQTFCSWMKDVNSSNNFFGSDAGANGEFHLILNFLTNPTRLFFNYSYYGQSGAVGDSANAEFVTPNNIWNYACIVKTAASTFDVYLNGNLVMQNQPKSANLPSNFSLGRRWGPGPFGPSYVPSNISLVQAYNRALTAQEVLQNYDALKYRFGL